MRPLLYGPNDRPVAFDAVDIDRAYVVMETFFGLMTNQIKMSPALRQTALDTIVGLVGLERLRKRFPNVTITESTGPPPLAEAEGVH